MLWIPPFRDTNRVWKTSAALGAARVGGRCVMAGLTTRDTEEMDEARARELALIQQSRQGASAPFCELVRLHQAAVRNFLATYVWDRATVEDLVQETFLSAYKNLAAFRTDAPFRPWLLGIARRNLANYLRDTSRKRTDPLEEVPAAVARWEAERVADREPVATEREVTALRTCIEGLAPATAEMVDSYYLRSLTAVEIAKRVGKDVNAVRMNLMRVRRALRKCVEQRLAAGGAAP